MTPTAGTDPRAVRTRFAPAPTGFLHLGHVANAINVWGLARARRGSVLLRIEDHDRQRCRPGYDAALIEDLAWLGFEPDGEPIRQSDHVALDAYATALGSLRTAGVTYGCECTRSTFTDWAASNGRAWSGPGCPGACRNRGAPAVTVRVTLGGGSEAWMDDLVGPCQGEVATGGDLVARDRHGNWAYGFAVVVDDLRQDIDLVIRGHDLIDATASQIRLARMLGRDVPPRFAHHRLVRRSDGRKLSKADGDTSVRELRAAGRSAASLIGEAAFAIGLIEAPRPTDAMEVEALFDGRT